MNSQIFDTAWLAGRPSLALAPVHRAMVAVDVQDSTSRPNPAKALLRSVLYALIEIALQAAGIAEQDRDRLVDRGDGVLMLVRPVDHLPKTILLSVLVPVLCRLLTAYNTRHPGLGLRLRVAVHAGEVHHDRRGPFGEAVDVICRLLDAPDLKATLEDATSPLALVVSGEFYDAVVRQGYAGIDEDGFTPLVRVEVGGQARHGWVHVPGRIGLIHTEPGSTRCPAGGALLSSVDEVSRGRTVSRDGVGYP